MQPRAVTSRVRELPGPGIFLAIVCRAKFLAHIILSMLHRKCSDLASPYHKPDADRRIVY